MFDWISPDEACGSEGVTIEDALAFDNDYRVVHYNGYISNSDYSIVTDWSSNNLVTPSYTFNTGYTYNYNDFIPIEPIGAFYESTSLASDPALSIADKTPVVLNTAGQGLSAAHLAALDANRDGKLSGTELGALTLWADRNENGRIDAGEVTAAAQLGVSEIKADDYGYFTRGNSRFGQSASVPGRPGESTGVPAAPGMVNIGASAAQTAPNSTPPVEAIEGVPASNFRSLRDTDNIYYYSGGYILWAANQVKINYNNRSYLIGSDGNDNFDASYYAKYDPIYFNTSLLVNFLGGGGDDTVGGSARNDRIWGGIGNDTLLGYAGADKLYGEEGDDNLQGGANNDYLDGGIGTDTLFGESGDDVLYGGDGNDLLIGANSSLASSQSVNAGESDNDKLYGGTGDDNLFGGLGNDELQGDIGNDRLFGQVGDDVLYGGDGDDVLVGFTASDDAKQSLNAGETDNDRLFGGAGADTLVGGLGNDLLEGGSENDYLEGDAGTDTLFGEAGADTLYGGAGDDYLDGGSENDILVGDAGNDTLFGGIGNDELQGGDGSDRLLGQSGDDNLFGQTGDDVLWGGDGNDLLMGFTASNEAKQSLNAGESDNDYLYGEAGTDRLFGGLGSDYLDGGSENDYLDGGDGSDTLFGGAGDDELHGGTGDDTLSGQDGVDLLFGEAGNDTLFGGIGNDELQGGDGSDRLLGEAGDDKLFGQTGDDVLWGGDGNDLLVGFTGYNESKQTLSAGESDNDYLYGGTGGDNLFGGLGDDTLDGGADNDLLCGNDGSDTLWGGTGDDELQGNNGNDRLMGEAGSDRMFGGVGNDALFGGDGDDVLLGFTPSNDAKQTLSAGETDDDILYGGAGNDFILGGLGSDTLYGEADNDELEGGAGSDIIYGDAGNDRLFGQVGDDVLYGGDGDDILVGFTGYNEAKQTLSAGESDNDYLYGGAGSDILLGGLGNDYLDGGAGADVMEGGAGDDIYIVNSVNDSILERANEGRDVVISSSNYLLNNEIEELRLVEGFNINGTGNACANTIIGNSANNILDGVTGADIMIGRGGNDTYYVDNAGDRVVENAGEGTDTVQSSISHTLGDNVENLILLDFSMPEKGLVDGKASLVYGYPKRNELDYMQGNAIPNYQGTCALTSIANLLTQANRPTTEGQVVQVAINNNWAVTDPTKPAWLRGGSNASQQQQILSSFGIANKLLAGYNEGGVANLIRSGRGVIIALDAGVLWGDPAYSSGGVVNHVVTVTGAVYGEEDGALLGFYIADSGRSKVNDMTRFIDIASFRAAANVGYAYAIYTTEPLKQWDENINGTGNSLNNIIAGNRGDNVLNGMGGDDTLGGGDGDDTYIFNPGGGNDRITDSAGEDRLVFGAGIAASQVSLRREGSNVMLGVSASDSVRLTETSPGDFGVERVEFSDGSVWSNDDIKRRLNIAPTGNVALSGTTAQNQTLTAGNSLADVDGMGAIVYQWQMSTDGVNWSNISGATASTFALTEALVGKKVRVQAHYNDGHGTVESVAGPATATIANVNDAPTGNVTISGATTQNQTLTGANSLADADGLGAIGYQWQVFNNNAWNAISGATAATFTLTEAQVGKQVRVIASYTDGHGTAELVTSAATATITNFNDASTGSVTISGITTQNQTLTASNTLADADGLGAISYQWQVLSNSTWTSISGATASTFTLTEAQVGKQVRVQASYTDGHGTAESVASAATAAIANVNDAPTGSVTISGTATQNQTLTAANTLADPDGLGAISYQWQVFTNTWNNISGATAATFVLTEAQVGKQVRVQASYTDGHGTAESMASAATATIANFNDAPTGSVTVSGTATQNQTLTAANTLADPDGLGAISYQWQVLSNSTWTPISGATASTFILTEAQVGKQVRVQASYTDGHGTAELVASAATAAIANVNDAPTGSVTISGTATQNQTLAAANTLADPDGLGAISYQWQVLSNSTWTPISGATGATFTLTEAQVGKQVRVTANYTDGHGTAESMASAATATIANVNDAPTGSVTISGTATQNQTLTATNTLADADGIGAISYQWQVLSNSTWTPISGATAATFTLTEAQVGKQVRVQASYTDGHGAAESMASAATAAIANVNDAPTGSVTISGTTTQNQTLTASNTLADADGLGAISYQWQVLSNSTWTSISGATASTFTLTEAQVGKQVRVQASYTDGHGAAESMASAATAAIANVNDAPTGSVTISGTTTQNQTLTATNTLADADGLGAISYQWQVFTNTWTPITGATAATFTLTEAHVGKQVRVTANYTDGHGTAESMASAATATIANVNDAPTGSVTINGTAAQNLTLTASNTLADADGLGAISYQWQVFDSTWNNISGATAATFVLTEDRVGKQVRVQASYTDGHGTGETIASTPTAVILSDTTAPTLLSSTPTDNAGGVSVSDNLSLTFSETVIAGTGTIGLYRMDGTLAESFDVATGKGNHGGAVRFSGATVTINPASNLAGSTEYCLQVANTAITDRAGNRYAGIANSSTLNFTTQGISVNLTSIAAGDGGFVITGQAINDFSGWSVSSAGDVNNDGLADVIIGAPYRDAGSTDVGQSYVVFGRTVNPKRVNLDDIARGIGGFTITGESGWDNSGYSVSSAGDVNGDGLADLIVGAHGKDGANGWDYGESYVVFGKCNGDAVSLKSIAGGAGGFAILGGTVNDLSGYSVSSAGDVNGDGLADLIVGAPGSYGSAGGSYVVFGKKSGNAVSLNTIAGGTGGFVIVGGTRGDNSGQSVSTAGDVNGDGLTDLIVGAPGSYGSAGGSYVVFGKNDGRSVSLMSVAGGRDGFVITGGSGGDRSGQSVSTAGDVNGDGLADLIVGAPGSYGAAGGSYVVFGKKGGDAVSLMSVAGGKDGFVIIGGTRGDNSGQSVSSAGDVNCDGLADLIVGAPGSYGSAGGSYVVYGQTGTTAVSLNNISNGKGGFVIIGGTGGDNGGQSVSSAGDGNGDGLPDLIVGAPKSYSTAGGSYVVYDDSKWVNQMIRGSGMVIGSTADEVLVGSAGADNLYGNGGTDRFYGGAGNDCLYGGSGNDFLDGGFGNDTLQGGLGNDTLNAGSGSDTYRFGRGDGQDTISEADATAGNTDVAQFLDNIAIDQLWFRHVGNNLEVSVIGASDKVTVQNWYSGSQYHLEQFKTSDNKVLLDTQVEALVQAMASFTPPASGQTTLPPNYQTALAPVIAANWH